jgi:hypothetical protein
VEGDDFYEGPSDRMDRKDSRSLHYASLRSDDNSVGAVGGEGEPQIPRLRSEVVTLFVFRDFGSI